MNDISPTRPVSGFLHQMAMSHAQGVWQEEGAYLKVRVQGGGNSLSSGSAGARVLLRSAA